MSQPSRVRVALVLPELLGTYGDRGNATVLVQRLRWRSIDAEMIEVSGDTPVPADCDIYVIGGGEDIAQLAAVRWLQAHPGLQQAVGRGAVVLAVCAGFQILGTSFAGTDGAMHSGLGLFDAITRPLSRRAIGEIVVEPAPGLGIRSLTGFENHGGATQLGPGAAPLGRVVTGIGNGFDGAEGVVQGRIVGTYLHGPVLARNPDLADLLLTWATGRTLDPLSLEETETLRQERLQHARAR
ncbi:type 1 glutamine amidotransferase [Gandjariella thermophila]|uniref:Lipid II isoglutaminyl synthase (glutamine-hydrolyzing) subunit GatD n=1 Tax=Gandjariella thermophila TaxID=1931992 RepID=A0A4D4JEZ0_9PSEU|nr:glutamine amidotransferase [Gandjariella thermophila]GDY33590.1 glutamine amidotransferase [Gandjariella thermophila]